MHGGSGTSTSFKKRYSQLSVLSEAQKREHMIRCVCARACLSVCARATGAGARQGDRRCVVLCWWDGSWMVTCACLCGCVVVFAGAVGAAAAGLFLRKVVPLRRETAAREGASGIGTLGDAARHEDGRDLSR